MYRVVLLLKSAHSAESLEAASHSAFFSPDPVVARFLPGSTYFPGSFAFRYGLLLS